LGVGLFAGNLEISKGLAFLPLGINHFDGSVTRNSPRRPTLLPCIQGRHERFLGGCCLGNKASGASRCAACREEQQKGDQSPPYPKCFKYHGLTFEKRVNLSRNNRGAGMQGPAPQTS